MPFILHLPTSTSWIVIIYVKDYLPLLLFCEHGKGVGFFLGAYIYLSCVPMLVFTTINVMTYTKHNIKIP